MVGLTFLTAIEKHHKNIGPQNRKPETSPTSENGKGVEDENAKNLQPTKDHVQATEFSNDEKCLPHTGTIPGTLRKRML